jgi:hypothetical protein
MPVFGERRALGDEAIAQLALLRAALASYEADRLPEDLDCAFAAARALIHALPSAGEHDRPGAEELRWWARVVPEFGALLSTAAVEAERVMSSSLGEVWRALGLRSAPPSWNAVELEAARMLFACACAAAPIRGQRVPAGLRGLAAARLATVLCAELGEDEQLWLRALGDRYESVRHRYARRTTWRNRGLSELVRRDEETRRAVSARLERWLVDGGRRAALAGELEATLVQVRTPATLA